MLRSAANDALVMHDDGELEALLGEPVLTRETIREWPLSWTQRLELANGRRFAYKSQLPPLIEAAFYEACSSPLLPGHRVLGSLGECTTLLVDWIEAPSLAEAELSEAEVLGHATEVVDRIGRMGDGLPAYLDVGTPQKWQAETAATLQKLRRLVSDGRFAHLASGTVDRIEAWASSPAVVDRIASESRLVHRDLKLEHIFVVDGAYRVIDWQVPAVAPRGVDVVWLLKEAGFDPRPHVDSATYGIAYFLHLRWAVVAQHDFFPEPAIRGFQDWASEGIAAILGSESA